jgi:hypothetical protein
VFEPRVIEFRRDVTFTISLDRSGRRFKISERGRADASDRSLWFPAKPIFTKWTSELSSLRMYGSSSSKYGRASEDIMDDFLR